MDDVTDISKARFMKGKAMAALLIGQSADHSEGDQSDMIARYRNDEQYEPQDCYARQYLQAIIDDPGLLDGFAAGLTHGLTAGMNASDAPLVAADIAGSTFEDCCTLDAIQAEQRCPTVIRRPGGASLRLV